MADQVAVNSHLILAQDGSLIEVKHFRADNGATVWQWRAGNLDFTVSKLTRQPFVWTIGLPYREYTVAQGTAERLGRAFTQATDAGANYLSQKALAVMKLRDQLVSEFQA